VIGVWDLYKLRQHFESLDLKWPLPGLGNATPLRDPTVDVSVDWTLVDKGLSNAKHQHYYKNVSKAILRTLGINRKGSATKPTKQPVQEEAKSVLRDPTTKPNFDE